MRLSSWLPPALWMVLIAMLSSQAFSASGTEAIVKPILEWLLPAATDADIRTLHAIVRKLAHFTEYAILAWLWFRAFVRDGVFEIHGAPSSSRGRRRAAWAALVLSAAWAGLDEIHQAFVPSRTASLVDIAIDAGGALAGTLLARSTLAAGVRAVTPARLPRP